MNIEEMESFMTIEDCFFTIFANFEPHVNWKDHQLLKTRSTKIKNVVKTSNLILFVVYKQFQ